MKAVVVVKQQTGNYENRNLQNLARRRLPVSKRSVSVVFKLERASNSPGGQSDCWAPVLDGAGLEQAGYVCAFLKCFQVMPVWAPHVGKCHVRTATAQGPNTTGKRAWWDLVTGYDFCFACQVRGLPRQSGNLSSTVHTCLAHSHALGACSRAEVG